VGQVGGQHPSRIAELIRQAGGPQNCVLATDCGVTYAPNGVELMREAIRSMILNGFSRQEVDMMVKVNPAKLLGI